MSSKKPQINIANIKDNPENISKLAKWHHREWSSLNPGQSLQDRIDNMQSYLNNEFIPSMFIAEVDKQLLGSAAIVKHDMVTRKELSPWLASVFVAAEYRNQGIGNKLVKHVMWQANKHNIKTLYLFTTNKVSFYQNLGWSVMEVTSYHCEQVTVMRKEFVGLE